MSSRSVSSSRRHRAPLVVFVLGRLSCEPSSHLRSERGPTARTASVSSLERRHAVHIRRLTSEQFASMLRPVDVSVQVKCLYHASIRTAMLCIRAERRHANRAALQLIRSTSADEGDMQDALPGGRGSSSSSSSTLPRRPLLRSASVRLAECPFVDLAKQQKRGREMRDDARAKHFLLAFLGNIGPMYRPRR